MDRTKELAKQAAAEAGAAGQPPGPDAVARAKAYLDLWERHLVHVALHGPAPAGRRPSA